MPELPEVEVVRRGLSPVVGRTIREVQVRHPRAVRRQPGGAASFAAAVTGATVTRLGRRGKYLWFESDRQAIVAHLGMSGQFRFADVDSEHRHLRIRFELDDDVVLHFLDQRTFGGAFTDEIDGEVPTSLAHIARDVFDPEFDEAAFVASLRDRPTQIKRVLLDQSRISGIGNIYADEALWAARLHYATSTSALSAQQVHEVVAEARRVMTAALTNGGTSFDAMYVNVNGESGRHVSSLQAYGRENEPCRRCGTPIVRESFTNRSSFRCPTCQPLRVS